MTDEGWLETPIAPHHDRTAFDCGNADLNVYLQRYARQNHQAGGAKCFVVAPRTEPNRILGFYTLSAAEILYARAPEVVRRGLGRYGVPVFRLGRLAVDLSVQGRGLGRRLLLAAGERSLLVAAHVGGVALLIDAKDEAVAAWYRDLGAIALDDAPLTLILPLKLVEQVLKVSR